MTRGKDRSLGELEELYESKIKHWADQRADLMARLGRCDERLKAYEEKLRWVRTLITAPEGAAAPPAPAAANRRRRRKSPVKDATYQALAARPGEWLTAKDVLAAIRKDGGKRVSRQSVNVNLQMLEKAGRVRRRPAPKGSGGAHYVFSATGAAAAPMTRPGGPEKGG